MSIFGRWFGKGPSASAGVSQVNGLSAGTQTANDSAALQQALETAAAHHNAGRLPQAERIYNEVLSSSPRDFNALHLLGVLYHQRGEHERAAEKIQEALTVNATDASAYNNLGECNRALRRYGEARECYEKAIALQPDWVAAYLNLGNLHRIQGRLDEALARYEKVITMQPDLLSAVYEAGRTLELKGDLHSAKARYEKVVTVQPEHKLCQFNLGNVLRVLGESVQAERHLRAALDIDKAFVPALINLGNMLNERGAYAEARDLLSSAIAVSPGMFEAQLALGNILRNLQQYDAALASYESALAARANSVEALTGLGNVCVDQGEHQQALQYYKRAAAANPADPRARWLCAIGTIPAFNVTAAEAMQARSAFAAELNALDASLRPGSGAGAHDLVGILQPFLLAYHDHANRDLLAAHGKLCARLMNEWQHVHCPLPAPPSSRAIGGKISVGIVSAHISDHSVWNAIVKGFVAHLDRTKFNVEIFYLGNRVDEETRYALAAAHHFESGTKPLREWVDLLASRNPDALIYPEIGMDAATLRLASMRLAPVQMASWGHPETTGLPTIDYYLSAEYLEPPDAAANYTERLVALPNLGCHVGRSVIAGAAPDLRGMGVDETAPLFLCPGVPFKYAPEDDAVLVEIARRMKRCQFLFFTHRLENLSRRLRQRLHDAFNRAGLDAQNHIVFVPWQNKAMFYGLMRRVDVYLDTIGFSGFNTAMQGIECGVPVVTREGRFMRGRLASGPLKKMGITELIARSNDEYADIAVKLASDKLYRDDIRQRILTRQNVLFDDLAPVRALEAFLAAVVNPDVAKH